MTNQSLMKVMLVDDEFLALEDLRTLIPWRAHGFEIVSTATNGKMALELFERFLPDLLIVDVKMPIMDGMELLRRLSLQYPDKYPKVILLTAYKEFDYAREALQYHVSGYLLKHTIDELSLLNEVVKVRREWLGEQKQWKAVHRQRLKKLLAWNGGPDAPAPDERAAFDAACAIGLIVLEANGPFSVMPHLNEPHFPIDADFIEELDWGFLSGGRRIDVVDGINGQCCLIVSFRDTNSQRVIHETLQRAASHVVKQYADARRAALAAVFTGSFGSKPLSKMYREACKALRYKWFFGKSAVADISGITRNFDRPAPQTAELDLELRTISELAAQEEFEPLERAIHRLFQNIKEPFWNLPGLYKAVGGLIDILAKLDDGADHQAKWEAEHHEFYKNHACGVNEIRDWFVARFRHKLSKRTTAGAARYSYKMRQAMEYIRKHYNEDLSVKTVSEALRISPSYLHQLFKKEVGQTFLEFLTEYRIKVAKELLKDDHYKIYEIAEITGYKTGHYFSQVFQRVTGVNPYTYKQQAVKELHP